MRYACRQRVLQRHILAQARIVRAPLGAQLGVRGRAQHGFDPRKASLDHILGKFAHIIIDGAQHDIGRRADLDHLAIAHDGDPIRDLQRLGNVMGDEHDGFSMWPEC